jgi:hypothetical protein
MATNKKHAYIFKMPKHVKLEFNELRDLLYNNFYNPYAKQILQEWITWAEDIFSDEQDFYQTCIFLNDTYVINDVIHWLVLHMTTNIQSGMGEQHAYAFYIQHHNLNSLILEKIKELMKLKGFM